MKVTRQLTIETHTVTVVRTKDKKVVPPCERCGFVPGEVIELMPLNTHFAEIEAGDDTDGSSPSPLKLAGRNF